MLALTAPVRADPQTEYELGRSRFLSARYEEAVSIFSTLLARPIDPQDPKAEETRLIYQRARPYYATTLLALGRDEAADAVILEQLRDDPFYELPPGEFPDTLNDHFIQVEGAHRPELEKRKQEILKEKQADIARREQLRQLREERVKQLEKLASEEHVTTKNRRVIATIPFGAGQFQNDDNVLGGVFLGGGVLLTAGAIGTFAAFQARKDVFLRSCQTPRVGGVDCETLDSQLSALRTSNWVIFTADLVLLASGIIEAHVNFVPEVVTVKKRPIPKPVNDLPPITVEPTVAPTEGGVSLGLRGRF
jgi:hypothetical protein